VKPAKPGAARLLNSDDGLAILSAALESRHRAGSEGDCSHLVHAIYERAGYSYSYADSSQLYAGAKEFRQVTRPQPGDLVVWRGHVGIVVNPAQHSFFSLLTSGRGVDFYDAPYWKQRGRMRFFRYAKAGVSPSVPVLQAKSSKPATLRNADARGSLSVKPVEASESEKIPTDSAQPSVIQYVNVATPQTVAVNSARPKPEQLTGAILQTLRGTDEALRGQDLFRLSQSLVIFDQLEVTKIRIKGKQGQAEIKISGLSSIREGHANLQKQAEQQRWTLTSGDGESWELMLPLKTLYLPREVTVRLLAHQLAELTDQVSEPAAETDKKAELARLLNHLLQK
jgi:hypothetical protein